MALTAISSIFFSNFAFADDVLLYDSNGNPAVVIDTGDQSTLYLANGQPIGYVSNGAVYSFQGKHLGWYSNGVLFDKNGYMLAFAQTNKPATVTIKTAPPAQIVKMPKPAVVTTPEVVTTTPTYIYKTSPTPIGSYFTVQPVE